MKLPQTSSPDHSKPAPQIELLRDRIVRFFAARHRRIVGRRERSLKNRRLVMKEMVAHFRQIARDPGASRQLVLRPPIAPVL